MRNEGVCTAIVFYDLEKDQINWKDLFYYIEGWSLKHGYAPLRGSADGEGIKATKTWTFQYTKRFLEKRDFQDIVGFWLGAYSTEEWDNDTFDAVLSCGVSTYKNGYLYLYFHNDIIAFDKGYLENLIKEFSQYLKAYYGIVYQRDFNKGPGFYTYGVITGLTRTIPADVEEREKISEWGRRYSWNYQLGQLRDIYPMNLLSEAHLSQPVFETTLQKWIELSPDHGELKPLTDILWEWWVPEDLIDSVREELRPTGIVICI